MKENKITRKFALDMACPITSTVLESTIRKVGAFTNTIGGRSRGVRLVGGYFPGVFEKGSVSYGKWKMKKTVGKCENVTQVVWRAVSYDDQTDVKKVLDSRSCQTGTSSGKLRRIVAECFFESGVRNV